MTFGGVTGFDKHRKDGRCLDPADIGFEERDLVWREPMSNRKTEWLGTKASRSCVEP